MIYGIKMEGKNIYYCEIEDLKKTRIYLEMKLPNIAKYSLRVILTILFISIFYLFLGKYNVVIKSSGVVRPSNDIAKSISPISGVVIKKCFQDGDYVYKGDILYVFENKTSQSEIELYKQKLSKLEDEVIEYKSILEFIENGKKSEIVASSLSLVENMLQKLKFEYENSEKDFESSKLFCPESISYDELKRKELSMIEAKIAYENYISEKKHEANEKITGGQVSINEIKNSLNQLQFLLDNYSVKSPANGYVYQSRDITEGEYILAGEEVLKIVPYESDRLKVIIYISPSDIAELKKDMKVRISFPKYPYSEYSALNGFINFIPKDSIVLSDGSYCYTVEAELLDNNIISRRTNKSIPILPGMIANVKIITRTESLYLFFYNKLFLDNKSID